MTTGWVPIGLGKDVPAGTTRSVLVEDRELVIWREADGAAHVWEDRCPHRGMRLSFGFVRDNALNCLYHGWQYGAGAQCLRIPAHPDLNVPPSIRANAYVAAEAGGMIWTRLDDRADAPLPDDLPNHAAPLVTMAVHADPENIRSAAGQHSLHWAQPFSLPYAGSLLHVGWHRARKGKTLLHALIEKGEKEPAIRFLRSLRTHAEQEMAV